MWRECGGVGSKASSTSSGSCVLRVVLRNAPIRGMTLLSTPPWTKPAIASTDSRRIRTRCNSKEGAGNAVHEQCATECSANRRRQDLLDCAEEWRQAIDILSVQVATALQAKALHNAGNGNEKQVSSAFAQTTVTRSPRPRDGGPHRHALHPRRSAAASANQTMAVRLDRLS